MPGPIATGMLGAARELFGGEAPVTTALLGWCVLLSGLCAVTDHRIPLWITDEFSARTLVRFGALAGPAGALEPWRYLAAVFLHANVLHIAMNGWVLASIGPAAESRFGRARFLVLFVLAGVLGFVASDQWYGELGPLTVGASGAIFGVFGSVVGDALARRDPRWKSILLTNVVWLVILGVASSVNNAAHLGGLVVGIALGFAFSAEQRKFRLGRVYLALALICALLVPTSLFLSNRSPLWRPAPTREFELGP